VVVVVGDWGDVRMRMVVYDDDDMMRAGGRTMEYARWEVAMPMVSPLRNAAVDPAEWTRNAGTALGA
jgi:hypothetical protein